MILKDFYNKKGINIGYAAFYIYEENGIVKQCWKTLSTMKDFLLINSHLLVNFWAEVMDIANYLRN